MKLVYETSATWHPLAIFSNSISLVTIITVLTRSGMHISLSFARPISHHLASFPSCINPCCGITCTHFSLSGVVRISCPRSRSPLDRLASFAEALMTGRHGPTSLFCIYCALTSMLLVLFSFSEKKSTRLSFIASHPSLASTFIFFSHVGNTSHRRYLTQYHLVTCICRLGGGRRIEYNAIFNISISSLDVSD